MSFPLKLTSPAFHDKGQIPLQYTRDGQDVSPPLVWTNVPKNTESLALICEDPDAPSGVWIHWVLYNIPSHLRQIEEGGRNLPDSVLVGRNSWNNIIYNGPHPPYGIHHYTFTLYALDIVLQLEKGATSTELRRAMREHILAESSLTGLYQAK
ncbi:MAG: YbhB/YbcL family Raf kinase inhibitor-like protein [Alphaproteobacteria bacterium]|nr:YbhB/YbcL family Raf kinase inhibitor-like protein [Alphaproteobacteria bacterium]